MFEYQLGGHRFTYMSDDSQKLSRIDRILVCKGFHDEWPNATTVALPWDESDHCPLILTVKSLDFGATPFRFFNLSYEMEGFDNMINEMCLAFTFSGDGDKQLAAKLKWLKSGIRNWIGEKRSCEGFHRSFLLID